MSEDQKPSEDSGEEKTVGSVGMKRISNDEEEEVIHCRKRLKRSNVVSSEDENDARVKQNEIPKFREVSRRRKTGTLLNDDDDDEMEMNEIMKSSVSPKRPSSRLSCGSRQGSAGTENSMSQSERGCPSRKRSWASTRVDEVEMFENCPNLDGAREYENEETGFPSVFDLKYGIEEAALKEMNLQTTNIGEKRKQEVIKELEKKKDSKLKDDESVIYNF